MTTAQKPPILVTGASGYIAGWIIKQLLEQGKVVHGSVRNPTDTRKNKHLTQLQQQFPDQLYLFKADLLNNGSFDEAMQGCEVVIHTASPFVLTGFDDAQKTLIDPALTGTRNVLESVNRTTTVKKVVLTSSTASVYGDNIDVQTIPKHTVDESYWNTSSNLNHQPYSYSKTIAEKAAWEMAKKQTRWKLVCINPVMVMGPSLTNATDSGSVTTLKQFGDGSMRLAAPDMSFGVVDVRDVAKAHVTAALQDVPEGRFILSAKVLSLFDIGQILKARFGARYPLPFMKAPKPLFKLIAPLFGFTRKFVAQNVGYPIFINNQRSRDVLGINYHDVSDTLCTHYQQLIDEGHAKKIPF